MITIDTSQDPIVTIDRLATGQLKSLIRLLVDSEKGFNEAAHNILDADLAGLFQSLAIARAEMVVELQYLVQDQGDVDSDGGTMAGIAHRIWLDLRSVIRSQDSDAILAEAERGENYIKLEYERAMRMVWGDHIHSLLSLHFLTVQATRDQIGNLRDFLGAI